VGLGNKIAKGIAPGRWARPWKGRRPNRPPAAWPRRRKRIGNRWRSGPGRAARGTFFLCRGAASCRRGALSPQVWRHRFGAEEW